MCDQIQHILSSGLPNALQLTWIAMAQEAEGDLYVGSLADIGRVRGVSRQAISKQVQQMRRWGALEKIGTAYRLTVDIVNPEVGDVNPEVDDVNPEVDDVNPDDPSSPSSPPSFSLPPLLPHPQHPHPISFPHSSPSILEKNVVEKISTAPPPHIFGWIGWLPPGHPSLAQPIPDDHPAVSERHLRYWKAAKWSIQLLTQAEEAIESFHVPAAVRRKRDDRCHDLVRQYAEVFRLLQEQDGYAWDDIRYALHWLFTSSDWLRNGFIASMGSLRNDTRSGDQTKFESILTQAKSDSSYDGPGTAASVGSATDKRNRSAQSTAERFERNYEAALRAVGAG